MKLRKFSVRSQIRSFKFAFNGLKILFAEEHNSRIHFLIAACVVVAGIAFKIAISDWIALVFAIGFVIAVEIFNSVVENIADFIHPGKHDMIKKIKDLSAAGVLVSAVTALIIGLMVFLPYIVKLLH